MNPAEIFKQIEKGTYEGFAEVSDEIYNQDRKYFRNSYNPLIRRSPAHLRAALDCHEERSHFAFGRALHFRLESRDAYRAHVSIHPRFDGRTREGKVQRERVTELSKTRTCIFQDEAQAIEAIASKIESDPEIKPALEGGIAEQAGFFKDPVTGVYCKFKMDLWRPDAGAILDFKSCDSAESIDDLEKKIYNYGYYTQAALYLLGASILTQKPVEDFICIFMEKTEPYEFRLIRINDASVEFGLLHLRENLSKFKQALETDQWPGYPRRIEEAGLPWWVWKQAQ